MKETSFRDVITDEMEAENVSREEVKIKEIEIHIRFLFVLRATVQSTDEATKIADHWRTEDDLRLKQEDTTWFVMGVTDLDIIKTSAHTDLIKKIKRGI